MYRFINLLRPLLAALTIMFSLLVFYSCSVVLDAMVSGLSGGSTSSTSSTTSSSANQYASNSTSSSTTTRSSLSGVSNQTARKVNHVKQRCPKCNGSGKCIYCKGTGERTKHYKKNGKWYDSIDCPWCDGSGTCSECEGSRWITTEEEVTSPPVSASSSSTSSSSTSFHSSSSKTYRTCSWCNGSGRILKETTQYGFSVQGKKNGKCSECGAQLYKGKGHKHYNCSHCNGTGKLEN